MVVQMVVTIPRVNKWVTSHVVSMGQMITESVMWEFSDLQVQMQSFYIDVSCVCRAF